MEYKKCCRLLKVAEERSAKKGYHSDAATYAHRRLMLELLVKIDNSIKDSTKQQKYLIQNLTELETKEE